jgi:hypothetical protein
MSVILILELLHADGVGHLPDGVELDPAEHGVQAEASGIQRNRPGGTTIMLCMETQVAVGPTAQSEAGESLLSHRVHSISHHQYQGNREQENSKIGVICTAGTARAVST